MTDNHGVQPKPSAEGYSPELAHQALAGLVTLGWWFVAAAAHLSGHATLLDAGTWWLGIGVPVTVLSMAAIARLGSEPVQRFAVAQSLAALLWCSLYAWWGVANALSGAMFASIVLVAAVVLDFQALARLTAAVLLVAALSYAAVLTAVPAALPAAAIQWTAMLVVTMAALLWAGFIARQREVFDREREDLQSALRRATRSAEHDELTNSYSRRVILDMLAREKARTDRLQKPFSICLLDIDHFKSMNDRFGHLAGDRILASFARRVRRQMRTMDSLSSNNLRSMLGRLGGEEFLVILPNTSLSGALRCAERIRQAVVRHRFGGLYQVTVSIGIAEYRGQETVPRLLKRADDALYSAKRGGRNRVSCSTPDGGPGSVVMPQFNAAG